MSSDLQKYAFPLILRRNREVKPRFPSRSMGDPARVLAEGAKITEIYWPDDLLNDLLHVSGFELSPHGAALLQRAIESPDVELSPRHSDSNFSSFGFDTCERFLRLLCDELANRVLRQEGLSGILLKKGDNSGYQLAMEKMPYLSKKGELAVKRLFDLQHTAKQVSETLAGDILPEGTDQDAMRMRQHDATNAWRDILMRGQPHLYDVIAGEFTTLSAEIRQYLHVFGSYLGDKNQGILFDALRMSEATGTLARQSAVHARQFLGEQNQHNQEQDGAKFLR